MIYNFCGEMIATKVAVSEAAKSTEKFPSAK